MNKEKKEYIKQWIHKARDDFDAYRVIMDSDTPLFIEITLYLLNQMFDIACTLLHLGWKCTENTIKGD